MVNIWRSFLKPGCVFQDIWKSRPPPPAPVLLFPRFQQRPQKTLWKQGQFCANAVPTRVNKGDRKHASSTADALSTPSTTHQPSVEIEPQFGHIPPRGLTMASANSSLV